jgi:hypothetical protein
MKKIAIQFFGHLRTFEKTHKSFFKNVIIPNIKDGYEIDIFIHTWTEKDHSTISFRNPNGEEYKDSKLSDDDKKLVQKIYNPKKILYENQLCCDEIIFFEKLYNSKKSFKGVLNTVYTKYKTSDIRMEYEKDSGIKYDWVIVTRPDIEFFTPFRINDILEAYSKTGCNMPENGLFYATKIFARAKVNDLRFIGGSDLIYFGRPQNISKATNLYNDWMNTNKGKSLYNEDDFFSFEFWFINYWVKQGLLPIAIEYATIKDFFPKFNKVRWSFYNIKEKIQKNSLAALKYILPYNFIIWLQNKYNK